MLRIVIVILRVRVCIWPVSSAAPSCDAFPQVERSFLESPEASSLFLKKRLPIVTDQEVKGNPFVSFWQRQGPLKAPRPPGGNQFPIFTAVINNPEARRRTQVEGESMAGQWKSVQIQKDIDPISRVRIGVFKPGVTEDDLGGTRKDLTYPLES
jgi:hypothetical protein